MAMKTSATILTLAEWPNTAGGILRKLFPLLFLLSFPSYEKKKFQTNWKTRLNGCHWKTNDKSLLSLWHREKKCNEPCWQSLHLSPLQKDDLSPSPGTFCVPGDRNRPPHSSERQQPTPCRVGGVQVRIFARWMDQTREIFFFFFQNNSSLKKKKIAKNLEKYGTTEEYCWN